MESRVCAEEQRKKIPTLLMSHGKMHWIMEEHFGLRVQIKSSALQEIFIKAANPANFSVKMMEK